MSYYKKIFRYTLIFITLVFFWFILHTTIVVIDGIQEDVRDADIGVIFGSKNRIDGSLSKSMERRLDIGLKLYKTGQVQKLIVTGGIAHKGYCEADLMTIYLLKNGVRLADIIEDTEALNTEENVENSLKIMEENNFKKLIIISQYYHISRIKLMYYKKGYYNIGSTSSHYYNKEYHPSTLLREFIGYYYYYFFK